MSQRTLAIREGVTVTLGDGWTQLPTAPDGLSASEWQDWAAGVAEATSAGDAKDGGMFGWMEGLVDDETRARSEAMAKMLIAEAAEPVRKKKRASLPFPLGEIRAYLVRERNACRGEWTTTLIGHGKKAALFWLFALGAEAAQSERTLARIVRWTGVRVNGEAQAPRFLELSGDSYGTMDWCLSANAIRHYEDDALVAFAVAAEESSLEEGFARLGLPPSKETTSPRLVDLSPSGRTAAYGPRAGELLARAEQSRAHVQLYIRARGLSRDNLALGFRYDAKGKKKGGAVVFMRDGIALGFPEIVAYLQDLAAAGVEADLASAALQVFDGEIDALEMRTLWIRALAEILGRPFVPPTSDGDVRWVECHAEWGYWLDPRAVELRAIEGWVASGALVLHKERSGHEVRTHHYVVDESGVRALEDEIEAQALIARTIVDFARASGRWPPHATLSRTFKNGSVEVTYAPSRYDTFKVRISRDDVGGDPRAFFDALGAAAPSGRRPKPVDEDRTPWRVEVATTGRATCRTCKETIAKGELRLGQPFEFEGHGSFRWHHLSCACKRLRDASKLTGFAALGASQQSAVRRAIG
jgi:hypothetical protein